MPYSNTQITHPAGLSLGDVRELALHRSDSKVELGRVALDPGVLFLMEADHQKELWHSVLPAGEGEGKFEKGRISFTFRHLFNLKKNALKI